MGLFSFIKNVGRKITGKETDAQIEARKAAEAEAAKKQTALNTQKAELMASMLNTLGLNVQDLSITVNDDHVEVAGSTASQADREKVILALGNIEGIASVEDNIYVVANSETEAQTERADNPVESQFYTVSKGDTLSRIAQKSYGNANKYPVIFEANKPMLTHPDLIYPGQVLRIPSIEA